MLSVPFLETIWMSCRKCKNVSNTPVLENAVIGILQEEVGDYRKWSKAMLAQQYENVDDVIEIVER